MHCFCRVQGRRDPSLTHFNTASGEFDTPRRLVEYSAVMAGAHTIHVPGDDDDHRLLGAQGFIFFPTLDWQVGRVTCRG